MNRGNIKKFLSSWPGFSHGILFNIVLSAKFYDASLAKLIMAMIIVFILRLIIILVFYDSYNLYLNTIQNQT